MNVAKVGITAIEFSKNLPVQRRVRETGLCHIENEKPLATGTKAACQQRAPLAAGNGVGSDKFPVDEKGMFVGHPGKPGLLCIIDHRGNIGPHLPAVSRIECMQHAVVCTGIEPGITPGIVSPELGVIRHQQRVVVIVLVRRTDEDRIGIDDGTEQALAHSVAASHFAGPVAAEVVQHGAVVRSGESRVDGIELRFPAVIQMVPPEALLVPGGIAHDDLAADPPGGICRLFLEHQAPRVPAGASGCVPVESPFHQVAVTAGEIKSRLEGLPLCKMQIMMRELVGGDVPDRQGFRFDSHFCPGCLLCKEQEKDTDPGDVSSCSLAHMKTSAPLLRALLQMHRQTAQDAQLHSARPVS